MTMTPIILVPRSRFGAWAWAEAAAPLRKDGHPVTAVTPRRLESPDVDRSTIIGEIRKAHAGRR